MYIVGLYNLYSVSRGIAYTLPFENPQLKVIKRKKVMAHLFLLRSAGRLKSITALLNLCWSSLRLLLRYQFKYDRLI